MGRGAPKACPARYGDTAESSPEKLDIASPETAVPAGIVNPSDVAGHASPMAARSARLSRIGIVCSRFTQPLRLKIYSLVKYARVLMAGEAFFIKQL
jgi:hypothetical protein